MKILWIVNTVFPDPSEDLGMGTPPSGGWMFGLANDIISSGYDLTVATVLFNSREYRKKINGIDYYILDGKTKITEYDTSLEKKWKRIVGEINPDIVHIHGMEFAHGLSLIKACPNYTYTISIQGILSECYRYYCGGIPTGQIRKYATLRDYLKNDGILQARKEYKKRSENVERQYFKMIPNIIGRSEWDADHTRTQNPKATYHRFNDTLRDSFYTSKKWDINKKKSHTIFISQATYPLKGFHKLLEAVNLIKDDFPDLKIRVAGNNIFETTNFKDRLKLRGYANYILNLLKQFDLRANVDFIGVLDESAMVEEYLNAHVFVCPSSIENCSNSVGESQLLGVPCIASYVGGIPDVIVHSRSGLLYRFDAVEMLAQRIKEVFTDNTLALKVSNGGIESALIRHDRSNNLQMTLDIYETIVNGHRK